MIAYNLVAGDVIRVTEMDVVDAIEDIHEGPVLASYGELEELCRRIKDRLEGVIEHVIQDEAEMYHDELEALTKEGHR